MAFRLTLTGAEMVTLPSGGCTRRRKCLIRFRVTKMETSATWIGKFAPDDWMMPLLECVQTSSTEAPKRLNIIAGRYLQAAHRLAMSERAKGSSRGGSTVC